MSVSGYLGAERNDLPQSSWNFISSSSASTAAASSSLLLRNLRNVFLASSVRPTESSHLGDSGSRSIPLLSARGMFT